jgi:hypothetical protein
MANECIPLFRPGQDISATASAAVVGKRFVAWTGGLSTATPSNLPTAAHAGAGVAVAGVSVYDAASGSRVAITRGKGSWVPVTAGAAITVLAEVEVGTAGKAITKASGIAVGRAMQTGVLDTDCIIELY